MGQKLKHLELIQGVINRLAANSFRIKGWSVVLVSALIVLSAREGRSDFTFIAMVPVLFFWGLDGYFLWQERLFRALYDHVRIMPEEDIDFSMNTSPFQQGWNRVWLGTTFSVTLLSFYLALAIAIILVSLFGNLGG